MSQNTTAGSNPTNFDDQLHDQLDDIVIQEITMQTGRDNNLAFAIDNIFGWRYEAWSHGDSNKDRRFKVMISSFE